MALIFRNEEFLPAKQTKKIFSITQKLDETYWSDWSDEIEKRSNLKEHATIIRGKLEKNGIAIEEIRNISRQTVNALE